MNKNKIMTKLITLVGNIKEDYSIAKDIAPETKFLLSNVYSSNGNKYEMIYVENEKGNYKFSEIEDKSNVYYKGTHGVFPYLKPTNCMGPMYDGLFAFSSDSRCEKPLKIFNRFESSAAYKTLST